MTVRPFGRWRRRSQALVLAGGALATAAALFGIALLLDSPESESTGDRGQIAFFAAAGLASAIRAALFIVVVAPAIVLGAGLIAAGYLWERRRPRMLVEA